MANMGENRKCGGELGSDRGQMFEIRKGPFGISWTECTSVTHVVVRPMGACLGAGPGRVWVALSPDGQESGCKRWSSFPVPAMATFNQL